MGIDSWIWNLPNDGNPHFQQQSVNDLAYGDSSICCSYIPPQLFRAAYPTTVQPARPTWEQLKP